MHYRHHNLQNSLYTYVSIRKAQSILEYFLVVTVIVVALIGLASTVFKGGLDQSLTNTEQSVKGSLDRLAP